MSRWLRGLGALLVLLLAPEVYLPIRAFGAQFHASAEGAAVARQVFAVLDELADGYSDGRRVHMTAYTARYDGQLRPGREIAELAWLGSADGHRCPPAGRRVLGVLAERGEID